MIAGALPEWPSLPFEAWRETCDTLHLWTQIVGKVRLERAPAEPEWAQVPLYLTSRGLTTSPMPDGARTFEMQFDFVEHALLINTSDRQSHAIPLRPQSVSAFYRLVVDALRGLALDVEISPMPQEISKPIPFAFDTVHASYDRTAVERFWEVLVRIDMLMKQHRAAFKGRHTPVQFFWGSFDLAYARYSGRAVEAPPKSNLIMRRAMDAEEVCAGFWPGNERFPEPAFFSYTYPKPKDIETGPIGPRAAYWSPELGEFILRYEDARATASPTAAILEFLESSYRIGAGLAGFEPGL